MKLRFAKSQIALAAVAALGGGALSTAPSAASAAKTAGQYVAGDFHNHTTCSDGSISMQKLVKKSTATTAGTFGLDWFVQAGHGGTGNRNCTLVEDPALQADNDLATPAYPIQFATNGTTIQGPTTTWQSSNPAIAPKGLAAGGTAPNANMWRWQSIQEFQYPLIEYLAAYRNLPLFIGVESVVAGHEHTSMSVITGQIPSSLDTAVLPTTPVIAANTSRYSALGNANALAQWEYCFDRGDTDTSRGNTTVGGAVGNNWNCSVTGSLNAGDPSWSIPAQKLIPAGGTGTGNRGHAKTIEAVRWMAENHPDGSYYVPAHLERAGPFNPDGNNGFNVESLRDFNNAAPRVAFGFETQPGHGASANRGEYQVLRNGGFTGSPTNVDSVGGTTYGGTGVYGAQVGGVWDALLGEGRNFWFFASSDWHNRGSFGPDDRRSMQDFYPGEYQRNYTLVRNGADKLRPQTIVDGLRTGNNFAASGQLIDRMAFIACEAYTGLAARKDATVEGWAVTAALNNTDIDRPGCATMGEKLVVRPGATVIVSIVVRDPSGTNNSPYSFKNPSLAQIESQAYTAPAMNTPVLDHIDTIRGFVTGYKTPGAADYAGEWPRNTAWLSTTGTTAGLGAVPAGAKNTSAAILNTFNSGTWTTVAGNTDYKKMTFRITGVSASQYVRIRGTNMPPSVPYETDANGNPLADLFTNASNTANLRIPCTTTGTNVPSNAANYTGVGIDGCPNHLATATAGNGSPIVGQRAVSFDVAAWADLWFYSNPIYVEVQGSTAVAGVQ